MLILGIALAMLGIPLSGLFVIFLGCRLLFVKNGDPGISKAIAISYFTYLAALTIALVILIGPAGLGYYFSTGLRDETLLLLALILINIFGAFLSSLLIRRG